MPLSRYCTTYDGYNFHRLHDWSSHSTETPLHLHTNIQYYSTLQELAYCFHIH